MGLNSFGTEILQVCKRSECVANQCFGSGRIQGGKMGLELFDTGIMEVCKWLECVADGCLVTANVMWLILVVTWFVCIVLLIIPTYPFGQQGFTH